MAASIPEKLKVLELYSGIGGMHWALKASGVDYEIQMAVDINTTANKIYQHNFPAAQLQSFGLEKLSLKKLESLGINTILMSPPCQPFTRVGKKGDCDDVRTKSFLHILQLIQDLRTKPQYILVENVKGFETSQTRDILIECLKNCGYRFQEFLLTPLQFGIPNCRLRYYLVAARNNQFAFAVQPQVLNYLPETGKCYDQSEASEDTIGTSTCHGSSHPANENPCNNSQLSNNVTDSSSTHHCRMDCYGGEECQSVSSQEASTASLHCGNGAASCENAQSKHVTAESDRGEDCVMEHLRNAGRNMRYCEEEDDFINENSRALSDFMEPGSYENFQEYWLSDKELTLFVVMDIVFPALKKSTCFTKRYGHYVDGAGSIVQMTTDVEAVKAASDFKSRVVQLKNRSEWGEAELSTLRKLQLRYFTPREVANLMCFPPEFSFPDGISSIQKYRTLGNSLNVYVVAQLIKLMTRSVET